MAEEIGVLTYDVPHRKTYDLLCLLKAKGYKKVNVFAKDMSYKKRFQPMITHRPSIPYYIDKPKVLCENMSYQFQHISEYEEIDMPKGTVMLLGGAGIIPEASIQKYKIINSHPGYIPLVRGLDAYKWAIYEGLPIGVTTHILGEFVDAGEVIERREIAIYAEDTFHTVANRIYENEIGMLVDAIEKARGPKSFYLPGNNELHKRMPHVYEEQIFERFEAYKQAHLGLRQKSEG